MLYCILNVLVKNIERSCDKSNKSYNVIKVNIDHKIKYRGFIKINIQLFLTTDECHKYDGFAEKEAETVSVDKFKEVISWKGDLKKHAEKAVFEFCPRLSDMDKSSPSDILNRIEMLHQCMETVYYFDAKCWSDKKQEFENFVSIQYNY